MWQESRPIRLGIVCAPLARAYGGPGAVVRSHWRALSASADIRVFGTGSSADLPTLAAEFGDGSVFPLGIPHRWFRGVGLAAALVAGAQETDVLHAHMLWDHSVWAAGRVSLKTRVPLIVTPHGSVCGRWRYAALHKRAYAATMLRPVLHGSRFVHVLNQAEADAVSEFGFRCPVRVIPNGIPLEEFCRSCGPELALERWPRLKERRVMLYMGRLWSGKGLNALGEAWAQIRGTAGREGWTLVLAGPDYKGYRDRLEERVSRLCLDDAVIITGPVQDQAKHSLLAVAQCFVLPSLGEGFSLALLEAAAAGLPAVFTTACNFPQLAAAGGGWELPPSASLGERLAEVIRMNASALRAAGRQARELCLRDYTLERVASLLLEMYRDAL